MNSYFSLEEREVVFGCPKVASDPILIAHVWVPPPCLSAGG